MINTQRRATVFEDYQGRYSPDELDAAVAKLATIHEDELPLLTRAQYDTWHALSHVDGVRVGPSFQGLLDEIRRLTGTTDADPHDQICPFNGAHSHPEACKCKCHAVSIPATLKAAGGAADFAAEIYYGSLEP
jgi:hypothetical protein